MSTQGNENLARRHPTRTDAYPLSNDTSYFSVPLPFFSCDRLYFSGFNQSGHPLHDGFPNISNLYIEDNMNNPLEDAELNEAVNFLLNDEADDFDLSWLPTHIEDLDDDIFGTGGGLELETKSKESLASGSSSLRTPGQTNRGRISDNVVGLTTSAEHPLGEHPSRTLFVRNINSSVEDSELRSLFKQFGDIRNLYTACKYRGFVMVSYYDIRASRCAMRVLQNRPLQGRKLDIHYSIPKDNPSEKDINQGTLVVFNLDPLLTTDELVKIFGAYGQIKEIRETPNKKGHKFIEYYDVRAAESALKHLNKSDICGKRVKLEPSRPGGYRRSLMMRQGQELEQDESRAPQQQVGYPIANSQQGCLPKYGNSVEHNSLHGYREVPNSGVLNSAGCDRASGLASILPFHPSGPAQISSSGKYPSFINQGIATAKPAHGMLYQQQFSVPDGKLSLSPSIVSPCSDFNSSSLGTLSGLEYVWGSPSIHPGSLISSSLSPSWNGLSLPSQRQEIGFPCTNQRASILGLQHNLGSAPSGIQFDGNFGFHPESPALSSYINQASVGRGNFVENSMNQAMNVGAFGFPSPRMMPLLRDGASSFGNTSAGLLGDGMSYHGQGRMAAGGNQIDQNKQYQIDLEKIIKGEDTRTTLMIKNIPNKYSSRLLLSAIDETHKNTYDFLYLPIDFMNKCNVGYAFINLVSPSYITSFYEVFHGRRWDTFNSDKVASLAYARIQGKDALISHFQKSSIMNEDKSYRPIVLHTEKQEFDNQNIFIHQPRGSYAGSSRDGTKQLNPNNNLYGAKN